MHTYPIRSTDLSSITALVNAAYRGEASQAGWTTEAHLLLGEKRTDEAALQQELNIPGTTILKLENEAGDLLGCVLLRQLEDTLYLGMLSVWPSMQTHGAGKQLMLAAEAHALAHNLPCIRLTVISVRTELIAWYQRRGYVLTGETKSFPIQPEFGQPTQPLEFVVMEKWLLH